MKRIFAFLLACILCVSCCSCVKASPTGTIDYNDDFTEMYFNGRTYLLRGDYFHADVENDVWHIICIRSPYFYRSTYYGNNADNPEVIYLDRTSKLYLREDITWDNDTTLSVCDIDPSYTFKMSEVTTGECVEYEYDFYEVCNFYVSIEEYPYVRLWLTVTKNKEKYYLQNVWDSDYYEITDEFVQEIYRLGLDSFDYKVDLSNLGWFFSY